MKHLLILAAILFTITAQSQAPYQLLKSELFKDNNKESYLVFVKEDSNGGFYMVRMFKSGMIASPSGYYLEHYDANLKLLKEQEYAPEYHAYEKNKTLIGIVSSGDNVHIIDIQYNIKEKAFICMAHSASIVNFGFTDKELFRFERKDSDKIGTVNFDDLFFESMSALTDDSKVAFIKDDANTAFAVAINIRSKEDKAFKLYSFDNMLNKKLEHLYVRNVKEKNYQFKNIDVADGGNAIYLLGAAHTETDKRKHFTYEIVHISAAGEKVSNFENSKPFSESLKLIRLDNKLICAGFYSENKAKWYSGVSYFELDPLTLRLIKATHTPFEEQLAQKNKASWWQPKVFKPLVFRDILVAENQDLIINAEEKYITTDRNDRTIYNTDDIITARINSDGQPLWISNINKNSATTTDQAFISYTPLYSNKRVCYFINAAEKVGKNEAGVVEFGDSAQNRADLTLVTIDAEGKMDYKKLLDDDVNAVPFMTANGFVLNNTAFFLGRKGGKKQLLKLTL